MGEILQHVSAQRDHLQITRISIIAKNRYWDGVGLYISEIAHVQLINLYSRVVGVYIDVHFFCRFCGKWMREYFPFFILSNLLISTILIGVIAGM